MLAERYISAVTDSIKGLSARQDAVKQAAELIVTAALDGNKVFVFDRHGIIDAELTDRASGPALFRSLRHSRIRPQANDILLIASFHPDDPADLDELDKAKTVGARVIAVAPDGLLVERADRAVVNGLTGENGVITDPGIRRPYCPISGIINATIAWSITAEAVSQFMGRGVVPTIYWGEHLAEGGDKREEAMKRFASTGY